jgi:hypothetical protein
VNSEITSETSSLTYTLCRTPWKGDQPITKTLPTQDNIYTTECASTSIRREGFEPMIRVFEQCKTVRTLAPHRLGPGSRPGIMWGLWWTKGHWSRFSPSISVPPANHSTNFSITIITRGWHIRSLVAAVPSRPNWTPPPTTPIKKKYSTTQ